VVQAAHVGLSAGATAAQTSSQQSREVDRTQTEYGGCEEMIAAARASYLPTSNSSAPKRLLITSTAMLCSSCCTHCRSGAAALCHSSWRRICGPGCGHRFGTANWATSCFWRGWTAWHLRRRGWESWRRESGPRWSGGLVRFSVAVRGCVVIRDLLLLYLRYTADKPDNL
jgi:hypothetical protein